MRLTFSVLWFDDSEDYFDSLDLEGLKDEISSWGFNPDIVMITTPEEFKAHSPFEKYDLIVVDRNLEGYKDGQEFIADIRMHEVFTEVIFYSAGEASTLWDDIRKKELEGIFVSSRHNIQSKIEKVGRQSIRKILDLENIRGIVMAEVGELDLLLDEIIILGISDLPEDKQKNIFKRFFDKIKEQQSVNSNRLDKFIETPQVNTMLSFCDSNKRWENFNRVKKEHSRLNSAIKLGDYVSEILHPRNFLAHGRPKKNDDGGLSFSFNGKEYVFNDAVSLQLRQKILIYKDEFANIISLLKG